MSENTPVDETREGAPRTGASTDLIRAMIEEDLKTGKYGGRVVTRFPPEPNGYLHIGHARNICLVFEVAREYGGVCHLRFDDTNPETEEVEYVEGIKQDIRWLGFDWGDKLFYASDYFERLYEFAVILVKKGKAYVCDLPLEKVREYRGTVTEPGRPSPGRDRSVEENLELLERMRAGEFEDGSHTLRARIDMASPNMKMRDPLVYRIRKVPHHRRGDAWCIYPMYDFAHCLSDAIEGITHSICTLEFENNRELYDWFIREVGLWEQPPEQTEVARLNLNYTIMSKRKLLQLVTEGHVQGWDDPRMPTLAGLRRRGYTPAAIRRFCRDAGVGKAQGCAEMSQLEYTIRDELNHEAPRVLAVLDPLPVTITSWPEGEVETLDASFWPHDVPREGSRPLPFTREILIEREDFLKDPPRKWHRLRPGGEVRLRHGYIVKCEEVIEDAEGNVVRLEVTHDPSSRSGEGAGRRVKGTIHWVPAEESLPCEVRVYDRLFREPFPGKRKDADFLASLNPDSLQVFAGARVEPSLKEAEAGEHFQFERQGYFTLDPASSDERLVFNRTVSLKDGWAKIAARDQADARPDGEKTKAGPKGEGSKKKGGKGSGKAPPPPSAEDLEPAAREHYRVLTDELSLGDEVARALAGSEELLELFEAARRRHDAPGTLSSWVVVDVVGGLDGRALAELPVGAGELGELAAMVDEGVISGKIARQVLKELLEKGGDPRAMVAERGLEQIADPAVLGPMVDELLAANEESVTRYRDGNRQVMGFFVGQLMKKTRGKASPEVVNRLLQEKLEA